MKIRMDFSFIGLILIAALCLSGCLSPDQAILKIFTEQGLSLLEPARSYIALGGIFAVPKRGTSTYFDPYDTVPPDPGTSSNFNAIIAQQSANQSTGISAAISGLAKVIALPVGLSFDKTKTVKLAQIDSGGTRYSSQKIDALLAMPNTAKKLNSLLAANDGTRVYLVQELYTAKSISISTTDDTSLSASLGAAGKVATCSNGSTSGSNGSSSDGTKTNQQGGSGAGQKAPPTNSSGAAKPASPAQNSGSQAKKQSSSGSSPTGSGGSSEGASFSVCHDVDSSLSFTSTSDIPFAVRLNEIYIAPGKTLSVRVTDFKLPNTALGTTDTKASTWIDPNNPVVKNFRHGKH